MVDKANVALSKSVVESAGELTANAALANYDTVLNDVYGLFAMSQSYEDLEKNLEQYFKNTLSANGLLDTASEYQSKVMNGLSEDLSDYLGSVTADDVNSNFLKVEYEDFKAEPVKDSNLRNGKVLKGGNSRIHEVSWSSGSWIRIIGYTKCISFCQ